MGQRIFLSSYTCTGQEIFHSPHHFINKLPIVLKIERKTVYVILEYLEVERARGFDETVLVCGNFVQSVPCGGDSFERIIGISPGFKASEFNSASSHLSFTVPGQYSSIEIYLRKMNLDKISEDLIIGTSMIIRLEEAI